MTTDDVDHIGDAATWIRAEFGDPPSIAIVLGSGLGVLAGLAGSSASCEYEGIPHWPVSRTVGHAGRLVMGHLGGRAALLLCGRSHLYEGHAAARVVFPIRVLGRLGVRTVVLTNAAGGISPYLQPGVLMTIDDHLNLMGANPLQGPNDERLGPRFPDMSEVYSRRLRGLADDAARDAGLPLAHGIYAGVAGPSYETPAEIRALQAIGADAVGMSTVPEAIAARHLGLEVLGLSSITNVAAGLSSRKIAADEVIETGRRAAPRLQAILEGVVARL
jgi:purine-nucleoside phosphorylase